MEFAKEKSKVLHMSRIKPFIGTAGNQQAEQEFCWKGPGHGGWTLSLAGAKSTLALNKACSIFVCSKRSMARRLRVGILLTSAGEVTPGTVFSLGHLKFKKHVKKQVSKE